MRGSLQPHRTNRPTSISKKTTPLRHSSGMRQIMHVQGRKLRPQTVPLSGDTGSGRTIEILEKRTKIAKNTLEKRTKYLIDEIFKLIPSELNAKNKRFILKNLNENFKFNRYEDSFLWLKNAGVAIPTYNVEEPKVPFILNKQRNLFKLFQNDVGLLAYQYADGIQLRILSGDVNINFGAVYENAVAQELHAQGFEDLYYFN